MVNEDDQAWKWLALALHSALQGACVCHLVTSACPLGIVTKKNAIEWSIYNDVSRTDQTVRRPRTQIMALPDLLKTIRKPSSAGDNSSTSGIALSENEFAWLRRFHNDIRNQFTHFEPQGWSIEVSGIPDMARLVSRVIKDILEVGYAFRHKDGKWRSALHMSLEELEQIQLNA